MPGLSTLRNGLPIRRRWRQAECAIRGPRCRNDEAAERTALAELTKANNLPTEKAPEISTAADPGAQLIGDLLERFGITEHRVQYVLP